MGYLIDDTYNALKSLFQKHNRNFFTPDEYNDAIRYVQGKIIRESFDFMNVIKNRKKIGRVGKNDYDKEQFYGEVTRKLLSAPTTLNYNGDNFDFPDDYSFTNSMYFGSNQIEEISPEKRIIINNPEITPSETYPIYLEHSDYLEVIPDSIENVTMYYYKEARIPNWTYDASTELFNSSDVKFQDLELPESVFDVIIMEMALYFGIEMRQPDITQVFSREKTNSERLKTRE